MGAWGDSIFADDDALDIYHEYCQRYNQGKAHAAVRKELERIHADSLADSDDGPIFWFAVAWAQWEFGALEPAVRRKVERIVAKGLGLDRWREGGPHILAKREKAVREFLARISERNARPKKRPAAKRFPSIYQPGDCLAIELCDGTFGAAIVLATDDRHDTEGFDIVGLLEWHSAEKPPLKSFGKRRWIRPKKDGRLIPVVRKCFARSHRKAKKMVTPIGNILNREDDPEYSGAGFMGRWEQVVSDLEYYYGLRV